MRSWGWAFVFFTLCIDARADGISPGEGVSSAPVGKHWELVWGDEFDSDGPPDPNLWTFQTGGGGWGNNELEYYTSNLQNARVEDGHLIVEARKEAYRGSQYTSARLNSIGMGWQFGRIEIRAKLPSGPGTWPAIWMLSEQNKFSPYNWPDNGELDIMEHVGSNPNQVLQCIYTKNFNWMTNNGYVVYTTGPNYEEDFHVYAVEWDDTTVTQYIDGVPRNSFPNPHTTWQDWPFDQRYYLIINLALGGFGGAVDDNIFPQKLLIDYVRVFRLAGGAFSTSGDTGKHASLN